MRVFLLPFTRIVVFHEQLDKFDAVHGPGCWRLSCECVCQQQMCKNEVRVTFFSHEGR